MKKYILAALLLLFPATAHAQKSYVKILSSTPAVEAAAYATGDLVGGKITLTGTGAGGFIVSVELTDLAAQAVAFDVVIFGSNPSGTTFTENAAFDIADADLPKVLGVVNLPTGANFAFADNSSHFQGSIAIPYFATQSSGGTLYAAIISRGAPTFASTSDITLRLGVSQD